MKTINKKAFIGRIVDVNFQRQGIAKNMSNILYGGIWGNNFRCLSTISKNNIAIINLHKKEGNMKILQELPNNYLLIEIFDKH